MDLLAQMATYVRIVDAGSLSAAARRLRLSLPAVSRQLRALEAELGAPLLLRSTRRMSLTDAGRKWYQSAQRILRDVDEARAQVAAPDELHGALVVSAGLSIGPLLVLPRLSRLLQKQPRLTVELRLEDRMVDFVGDGVDLAVRTGAPPDSTAYVAHPFLRSPRQLFAAPAYLRRRGTPRTPPELTGHACLAQTSAGSWSLRRAADEAPQTLAVRGPARSHAPSVLHALARDGHGVALLPDWMAADDVAAGRLRRVLPRWEGPPLTAWAIYRVEQRGSRKLGALLHALGIKPSPAEPSPRG